MKAIRKASHSTVISGKFPVMKRCDLQISGGDIQIILIPVEMFKIIEATIISARPRDYHNCVDNRLPPDRQGLIVGDVTPAPFSRAPLMPPSNSPPPLLGPVADHVLYQLKQDPPRQPAPVLVNKACPLAFTPMTLQLEMAEYTKRLR